MIASRLNTYEQLMTDITSLSQSLHLTEQIITAIIQSTNSQLLAPLVDFAERDRLIKLHLLVDAIKRKLDDNSSAFSSCLYTAPELALGKELKKRGPELDKLLNTKFVEQAELIFTKHQELYPLVIGEQQLQDDIALLEESLHLGKQITAAIIQSTNHQLSLRAMESRRRGRVVPGSLRAGCFSAGKI